MLVLAEVRALVINAEKRGRIPGHTVTLPQLIKVHKKSLPDPCGPQEL